MSGPHHQPPVRLAELVGALSLGIDLGFSQPMEHVLRQCLIAVRIADRLGVGESDRLAVYYTALLVNVACHTDAYEQNKWFGDDLVLRSTKYHHEPRSWGAMASGLRRLGSGHPPLHRFRLGLEFIVSGRRDIDRMIEHHAHLARRLAEQLALPGAVLAALAASYERWDGRGWPGELRGAQIPLAARVANAAEYVEVAHRMRGVGAVEQLAGDWRGHQFDPEVADLLVARAPELLADLDGTPTWEAVLAAEPSLGVRLTGPQLEAALIAIADFVDLKSPYFLGHARAVADLAGEAARRAGLGAAEVRSLRHAGLMHGYGRLGISNAIWDKRGALGAGEWERVRMQPYLTDRILRQAQAFAPVARIAVQLRERLDGSGYPAGLSGSAISREARILGAADAYQSMCEPRPHRPAHSRDQAAEQLRAEVRAGRHDGEAVEAVLGAAGHRVNRRRRGPAGLTVREVEVLRLLARGRTNKEIARSLFISAKTVANHVEHIYEKIDACNRAEAGLFAMQHGLLPEGDTLDN